MCRCIIILIRCLSELYRMFKSSFSWKEIFCFYFVCVYRILRIASDDIKQFVFHNHLWINNETIHNINNYTWIPFYNYLQGIRDYNILASPNKRKLNKKTFYFPYFMQCFIFFPMNFTPNSYRSNFCWDVGKLEQLPQWIEIFNSLLTKLFNNLHENKLIQFVFPWNIFSVKKNK